MDDPGSLLHCMGRKNTGLLASPLQLKSGPGGFDLGKRGDVKYR